eukprot:m.168768 g.168768  ORF g.168768 m.168768 type:complete len:317 (-) comp13001_c0_seq1:20-970(-)
MGHVVADVCSTNVYNECLPAHALLQIQCDNNGILCLLSRIPAEYDVPVCKNRGLVVTVTLRVSGTVGARCPVGVLAVDLHIGKGDIGTGRHTLALRVHVDVFIHQHGIVVLSVARLVVRNVKGRIESRVEVGPRDCPHGTVGALLHKRREFIAWLDADQRRRHNRVRWISGIDKPRLESPFRSVLAILQHRLQDGVTHLGFLGFKSWPKVDHLAPKWTATFSRHGRDNPVRREGLERLASTVKVHVRSIDLNLGCSDMITIATALGCIGMVDGTVLDLNDTLIEHVTSAWDAARRCACHEGSHKSQDTSTHHCAKI